MKVVLKYDTRVAYKAGETVEVSEEEFGRLTRLGFATEIHEKAPSKPQDAPKAESKATKPVASKAYQNGSKTAKKK